MRSRPLGEVLVDDVLMSLWQLCKLQELPVVLPVTPVEVGEALQDEQVHV